MSRLISTGARATGVAVALMLLLQFLQPNIAAAAATISLNPTSGTPGTTVMVTGSGFQQNETVNVTFSGTAGAVATTTATGVGGSISTSFMVPAAATPGFHTVTATGATSGRFATANFRVLASPTTTFSISKMVSVNGAPYSTTGSTATGPPNAQLTYQIAFANTGSNTATNTVISDTLNPNQTLQAATSGCSATISGGVVTVTCPLGSVPASPAAGSSGAVYIVTTVNSGFAGSIPNNATISADNAATQTSNTTTVTVGFAPGPTSVSKAVSVDGSGYTTNAIAHPGDTLSYAIGYTNSTGVTQSGVIITDQLAPGQTLLSYPATSAACNSYNASTRVVTCTIGSAPPGTTVFVQITTAVDSGFSGTIPNQAAATYNAATIYSNTTTVQVPVTAPGPGPGFTGVFTLCGQVTSYTAGSITISGVTIQIAAGATVFGTIVPGASQCVSFAFNSAGQASTLQVSSNLAGIGVACGVYQPNGTATSISVSGVNILVQNGTNFMPFLVPGGFYCFLLTPQGVAFAVLTGVPTSATAPAGHTTTIGRFRPVAE